MATKKLSFSLIVALLCFAVAGCTPPQPANQLPLMIMVEDTVYQHSIGTLDASIRIDDSQILGRVSSVIGNQVPAHNGEANFGWVDMPYARCTLEEYSDGIVVFFAHQWYIFLPVDT